MKTNLSDKIIAWLALLSGLTISAVAIWYSVAGLVSIFAAAAIPIIVMGVVLEVSKLIATVWLKINWNRAPVFIRTYLLIAIAVLMLITSMGIFGFLSKAHSDAGLVSGDVQAKIAVYDEKIKTERENIDAARKALTQMDAQVNERLSRSTDDRGAERAVQIRRQQQAERTRLQNDISRSQSAITKLNEERAPIAAEVRKVEAEVGPIKYIANFIYGDNPDANILEKAVTWVIIIIVAVFDPLAVILLLASQYSFAWFRKEQEELVSTPKLVEETTAEPIEEPKQEPHLSDYRLHPDPSPPGWMYNVATTTTYPSTEEEIEEVAKELDRSKHAYLDKPFVHFENLKPIVAAPIEETGDEQILDEADENEKAAMTHWKRENPNGSLKSQRRLLEKGIIAELPWYQYLKPKADFEDDAVVEATKWAQEQLEKNKEQDDSDSKKKGSDLDRESGESADSKNVREVIYQQNAEQNKSTLWQRVKSKKNDE
jgi:hypothetical protein